ncbi:neprilysin-like isoform X2 [Macrobrachium nipponense]|uniref:neprilysin-like isoform X2 n=1 Tax=Macrobrachium nipponense TaxID=159736 RepID=UPI0030C86937
MDGMPHTAQTARRLGNASSELYPIMMPVGGEGGGGPPRRQEPPVGAAGNQAAPPPGVPQYNTMMENSVPLSHLRTEGGGYLGPAAVEEINSEFLANQARQSQDRSRIPGHLNNNSIQVYDGNGRNQKSSVEGSINADSFISQSDQQKGTSPVNCRTRTGCEKILLMGGSILLIIIIALAAGMVVLEGRGGLYMNESESCQTRDCVRAAGAILESLDETSEPCDNFVQFACGGWYATHPVPESMHKWSVLDLLDETTLYEVKSIMEEPPTEEESLPVMAARTVYKACIDDNQWSAVGLSPLLYLLDEMGGLPMIEQTWRPKDFRLEEALAWMRRAGGQTIVALTISPELTNSSYNAINLMQGLLPIPAGSLINATLSQRANHISFILKTVEAMLSAKGEVDNTYALQQALMDSDAMWNFTVELAKISEETKEDPWVDYNPMTVRELSKLTNHPNSSFKIDWLLYFKHLFNGTNTTVTNDDVIVVHDPWYFGNLTTLLNKTTTRTIANYLLYQVVYSMADETSVTLRDIYRSYETPLWEFGRTSLRPWYDCVTKVRILLPMAIGQMFFKKHSIENVTGDANKLVEHVTEAFRNMLRSATWMSNETTEKAIRKLDEMVHFVGYPDYLLDDEAMNEHMQGLPEVSDTDHFGNVVALLRWHGYRSLVKLSSTPSRTRWPTGPLEINAFYSTQTNAIIIPGGILQPQFFHGGMAALNYGGVGAIIGHEITHGFDNNGRHFDWAGRLAHWWDQKTMDQYVNRSKCFENQYSSYNVSDLLAPFDAVSGSLKINGLQSKGENLADNGGVRAAWTAYKKHIQETGENLVLPGLQSYNQDQLFFITFGRLWCMQYTPWALKYSLDNDLHPPGHYRILGSLQNTKEFADTFGCAKGSLMNPEKKCLLW